MNAQRWQKMALKEQMGNIGSEFARMIGLKQKGDLQNAKNSLARLLELIDLTANQRKSLEFLRLREVVCDIFSDSKVYAVSANNLKKYFLQFCL